MQNIHIHRLCGQLEQEGLLHTTEFTGILKLSCCMVEHRHPGRKGVSSMAYKALYDDQELTCRSVRSNAALELYRNKLVES